MLIASTIWWEEVETYWLNVVISVSLCFQASHRRLVLCEVMVLCVVRVSDITRRRLVCWEKRARVIMTST